MFRNMKINLVEKYCAKTNKKKKIAIKSWIDIVPDFFINIYKESYTKVHKFRIFEEFINIRELYACDL